MSKVAPGELQVDRPAVPWTKQFRKALTKVPTPDQLSRQDALLLSAWRSLGESGPVIAFLNAHDEQLRGQPLQLALESDEGLGRVERLLTELGQGSTRRA